jgi:signal peptidase II
LEERLSKLLKDYLFLFGLAGVIVALDQWTKHLVRTQLDFGQVWSPFPWLTPYARVIYYHNTGAAFGMFQGYGGIFTVLAIIVAAGIIYYFPRLSREDWLIRLAMGLMLGGAIGNLIDRVTIGTVTDFISVGSFAVFNVADSCITVGVGLLLLGVWSMDAREKKSADQKKDTLSSGEGLADQKSEQGE